MKILLTPAIIICKITQRFLRIFHRGGTNLPGLLALKICPEMLKYLSEDVKTVIIAGTNGKTTTAVMLRKIFDDNNLPYISNRSGANLISGITTEYAVNATVFGKPKKRYAIIECDEAALKNVALFINPEVITVTNLFRDQLDRYGEVSNTLKSIEIGVKNSPRVTLCLNADCSLTASLSDAAPNKTIFYGIDENNANYSEDKLSDAARCLKCGEEYGYTYHTYGHLGGFYCSHCGYKRPKADIAVTKIKKALPSSSEVEISAEKEVFSAVVALPAIYNIYNAVAAISSASAMGLDVKTAASSLAAVGCAFGRMERFSFADAEAQIILVKNPAGCNQAISFIAGYSEKFTLAACLNDNYQDGTDVSWIWDCDFEKLMKSESLETIVVSGTRAEDMRLRLKYAGADENRILIIQDPGKLADYIEKSRRHVFAIPNYTAMLDLRARLNKKCGGKDFWE